MKVTIKKLKANPKKKRDVMWNTTSGLTKIEETSVRAS